MNRHSTEMLFLFAIVYPTASIVYHVEEKSSPRYMPSASDSDQLSFPFSKIAQYGGACQPIVVAEQVHT